MASLVLCVHRHGRARVAGSPHAAETLSRSWGISCECFFDDKAMLPFNDIPMRIEANARALRERGIPSGASRVVIVDYDADIREDPTEFISSGSPPGTTSDLSNVTGLPFRTMMVPAGIYGPTNLTDVRRISDTWKTGVFDEFRRTSGRLPDALDLTREGLSDKELQIVESSEWKRHANCALLTGDDAGDDGRMFLRDKREIRVLRISCELFRRGSVDDLPIREGENSGTALAIILSRIHEITFAPSFYSGKRDSTNDTDWTAARRLSVARRKWIPGTPMVFRMFSINSREAIRKYVELSERTMANNNSSGAARKNMITMEETVNGINLTINSLIRPLADCEPNVLRDYVANLSGLGAKFPYPANRRPLTIRMARCSADFRTMHFDKEISPQDLPRVSVLTITRNRRRLFPGAKYNFEKIEYPRNKLEWVIVDDSDEGQDVEAIVGDELLRSGTVKYVRLPPPAPGTLPVPIGMKRQIACENASGDVFVIRDDDDYYCPQSVMIQVRTMLEYPGCEIVGSSRMLSYNVRTGTLFFTHSPNVFGEHVAFPEPTVAFRRSFWEERPWQVLARMDEGRHFQLGRDTEKFVEIICHFIGIICSHGGNFTGSLRNGAGVAVSTNVCPDDVFPADWWNLVKHDMLRD